MISSYSKINQNTSDMHIKNLVDAFGHLLYSQNSNVQFSQLYFAFSAVGDPPNVLIVSAENLTTRGINFGNFTMHLFPGAYLACLVGMATIRLMYRNIELVTHEDLDSRAHRRELNTWKQVISRSQNVTEDEKRVRRTMVDHFRNLVKSGIEISETKTPKEAWAGKVHRLETNCQVDKILLAKCSVVLTGTYNLSLVLYLYRVCEVRGRTSRDY